MGRALAERLLEAGHELHVVEPAAEAREALVRIGAVPHETPASLADTVEVAFACLPNVEASREVTLGPAGVVQARRLKIYVETSTIGQRAIAEIHAGLAARGISLVDAPVSGGPSGARAGTLATMVAGGAEAVAAVRPALDAMAGRVFVIGDRPGLAQTMKLANNLLSATNMAAAFEILVFGVKAGLDPGLMVEVLNASSGRNSATEDKIPRAVLPRSFDYGARVDIIQKDVELGLQEAAAAGVPVRTLLATGDFWRRAMEAESDRDFTAGILHLEREAGIEVAARPPGS